MLLDHFFANGEPQSGASRVGRESRLEYLFDVIFGNSAALIFKINLNLRAFRRKRPSHIHNEPTAWQHRAKCIERKIEKYLLQAVRVGMEQDFSGAIDEPHLHAP